MEPPHQIEFEHRRVKPEAVTVQINGERAAPGLARRVLTRARWSRALFVLAGAVAIAWGTQRAGIALPQALCLFFGALPVLWVGGWVAGALFQVRSTSRRIASELGSSKWREELEAAMVTEKVKLSVEDDGLTVTRDSGVQRWAWSAVSMNRLGPTLALRLGQPLGPGDHLEVPESAFLSPAGFDDFCLLIQRRLWEAEREAFTSRRA